MQEAIYFSQMNCCKYFKGGRYLNWKKKKKKKKDKQAKQMGGERQGINVLSVM